MHTESSEGEERRPHQMHTHSQYQDEGLLLAQWRAGQRHPDGRSFSLAIPTTETNRTWWRCRSKSASTVFDFARLRLTRIDGRRLCEDHRGYVQDAKRAAYAITSRLSLMRIAILAGLQIPGLSDGRVEFNDGCSMRTAVPRIWMGGRYAPLTGDASPMASTTFMEQCEC